MYENGAMHVIIISTTLNAANGCDIRYVTCFNMNAMCFRVYICNNDVMKISKVSHVCNFTNELSGAV